MRNIDIDAEISLLLYRMGPVSLRLLMAKIATYIAAQNKTRITAQKNADGSTYEARKNTSRHHPMLVGYAKRITQKVELDHAVIGIFGRLGNFGSVHDQGKTERRVKYPARNILSLPVADKTAVLGMIREHIGATRAA